MNQEEYMKDRVDNQMNYYSRASRSLKQKHTISQITIISLGLIIPVIVNLEGDWFKMIGGSEFIRITTTILSLILAVFSGIANFLKFGELWITFRSTLEALKREKYFFITSSGKYRNSEAGFHIFVENIEAILSNENAEHKQIIEKTLDNQPKE